MDKEYSIPVDQILSGPLASHSKSEAMLGIVLAAWEAKQRGETHITITFSTKIAPCSCCEPPVSVENPWE